MVCCCCQNSTDRSPATTAPVALLASLVLRGMAAASVTSAAEGFSVTALLAAVLQTAVFLNVLLAVFNLVPVPPLDGGNVIGGLLRGSLAAQYDRIRPYGFMLLYGLMFTGALAALITPPAQFLLSWLL